MDIIKIVLFLFVGFALLYALNWIVAAVINKGANMTGNAVRHVLNEMDDSKPEKLADRFRNESDDAVKEEDDNAPEEEK